MIDWLENIDRSLFLWLNSFHSTFFDDFFLCVTNKYFGIPFYLIGIVLLIKGFGWKKGLILTAGAVLAVALADQTAQHLFKNVFERWRPTHNNEIKHLVHIVNDYRGGVNSFVSSHAANMFAIAMFLGLLLNRKVMIVGILIAGLIAYSRVYLGVHYPADILCGAVLGICIGWLVYRFFSNLLTLKK